MAYKNIAESAVIVDSLSKLPEPVGGIISLDPNKKVYQFKGLINIGTNRILVNNSHTLLGLDKSDDGIIYTGTAAAVIGNNTSCTINNITISSTGKCFEFTNTLSYSVQIRECIFSGAELGTINGGNIAVFNNNICGNIGTLLFTGAFTKIGVSTNYFLGTSNLTNHVMFNSVVCDNIKIIDNDFIVNAGKTGIYVNSVTINNQGGGSIVSNSFAGVGTYISGVQDDTLDWIIESNGAEILSTSGRRFIRKIRNEQQLNAYLALPNPSDYVYEIDGVVTITNPITVPSTGLTFRGYGNNFSTIKTDSAITMFIGGGNFFANDLQFSCNVSGAKVFALTDPTGFNAVEFVNVNFVDCDDLGSLANYRQGLLLNGFYLSVRQGILFQGTWAGGFRVDASRLIFNMVGGTYMFKSDVGHTFGSRFFSNANSTIGAGCIGYDFTPSNFVNDATFQLIESQNDGAGTYVNPAITASSIKSLWRDNVGIDDTFVGIVINNTVDTTTTITAIATYTELRVTTATIESAWTQSTSTTNFNAQYLSSLPSNVSIELFASYSSGTNHEIEIEIRNYEAALSGGFTSLGSFRLTTNGGTLGTRVEPMSIKVFDRLVASDRIRVFVRNNTAVNNIATEGGAKLIISKR